MLIAELKFKFIEVNQERSICFETGLIEKCEIIQSVTLKWSITSAHSSIISVQTLNQAKKWHDNAIDGWYLVRKSTNYHGCFFIFVISPTCMSAIQIQLSGSIIQKREECHHTSAYRTHAFILINSSPYTLSPQLVYQTLNTTHGLTFRRTIPQHSGVPRHAESRSHENKKGVLCQLQCGLQLVQRTCEQRRKFSYPLQYFADRLLSSGKIF